MPHHVTLNSCFKANSCNFTGNKSPVDGGAILATGGSSILNFTDCRFEDNTAGFSGGGVRADSASLVTATNSLFMRNAALGENNFGGEGGGVYCPGGSPQVHGSLRIRETL